MMFFDNIEDNIFYNKKIKNLRCCDEVVISVDDCLALEKLFKIDNSGYCKSDLIFGHMVPLQNVKIVLNGILESNDGYPVPVDSEIYIFDEYKDLSNSHYSNIGVFKLCEDMYTMLTVSDKDDYISHGEYGFVFNEKDQKSIDSVLNGFWQMVDKFESHKKFDNFMDKLIGTVLRAWYIVQISLLNPITKDVFTHPIISTNNTDNNNLKSKNKRRKNVKYIKRHFITAETVLETINLNKTNSKTKRKYLCQAWYVCGHYRNYANGNRVFIKPYWKGELRNEYYKAENIQRSRVIAQLSKQKDVMSYP